MTADVFDVASTALLLVDLQNDFIHPRGAYARGRLANPDIGALPGRIAPLAKTWRAKGGLVVATHFTLVPGRGGDPIISPHLKAMRPFLTKGDFAPGSWGQQTVEELQPIDVAIEKVAYSAFYMSRLEWVLRKLGMRGLVVGGIVTNGGVASTVREAHVRDIPVTVMADACAAFSPDVHSTAIAALQPVARIASIADVQSALGQ